MAHIKEYIPVPSKNDIPFFSIFLIKGWRKLIHKITLTSYSPEHTI